VPASVSSSGSVMIPDESHPTVGRTDLLLLPSTILRHAESGYAAIAAAPAFPPNARIGCPKLPLCA